MAGLLGHYLGVLGAACLLACYLPTEIWGVWEGVYNMVLQVVGSLVAEAREENATSKQTSY